MSTCLGDALFPQVPRATAQLLERLGHVVVVPEGQTCCGQMHVNSGYLRDSHRLVRHHADVFGPVLDTVDAIVAPSASCVGSVRHQHAMVARRAGDDRLEERAAAIGARTYELSELLVDVLGVVDVGAYYPRRVTYHPTCHSLRVLRVHDRPLRLLRAVEGLELVELDRSDECCGFGGTFALKNADASAAMLDDKVDAVERADVDACTAGDASCLMHIGGGLSRRRARTTTVHLAEILASSREQPAGRGPWATSARVVP